MKQCTFAHRITILILAFSLFSLLFTGNEINEKDKKARHAPALQHTVTCQICRLAGWTYAEELSASGRIRITRSDTAGKSVHPENPAYYFTGGSAILIAAGILYIALVQVYMQLLGCRRYIIRYIHDQEGYKDIPSLASI